ncbi:type I restriction-modification system subunit M [Rhizobium leguminosarum]|uniref:type I restriction-modification system subunit M n=1 Tax=Rhizobium leguminosarum TaxID=384 RepID=UPI001C937A4E|nr:class I SAM-dependent DNA methyltransferase [Rhizobium leguminosarum]MBY5424837.1 SAM-dependent DNA methyltransferase [Rhizobium leguminosarum]
MIDQNTPTEAVVPLDEKELGIDPEALWAAADKLRGTIDAAEYKHVVLGLIFLKYISDAFETRRGALRAELEADGLSGTSLEDLLESRDEYTAENVFWVPPEARWMEIQAKGKTPTIGKLIDDAMYAIEKDNPKLRGKLPRDYARRGIAPERLGGLVDQIASIAVGTKEAQRKDILGRVYEYFLGKFAAAEGKLGGEFFTPSSIVRLMVEMIEPFEGRVYDPACGSGGMFVQSERFAEAHGGSKRHLSVFGQESNPTTWRLAHMNLAIRGIEANLGEQPADSFSRDLHPDLKADYILANPPFNISDWSGNLLRSDKRWKYGTPPVGNANYAWIQHFIHHLAPPNGRGGGIAAFVMANGSLSSAASGEGEIRRAIIEADLVDCIIAMPPQLFLTTGIPVCLWFVTRDKSGKHLDKGRGGRNRTGETLFVDARAMGQMETRTLRVLSGRDHSTSPPPLDTDIGRIVRAYHAWRGEEGAGEYQDVKGFSKAAKLDDIRKYNHVLSPGTYVGTAARKADDEPFNEKMIRLVAELTEQLAASDDLTSDIRKNLGALGYEF